MAHHTVSYSSIRVSACVPWAGVVDIDRMIDPEASSRLLVALIGIVYLLVSLAPPARRRTDAMIVAAVGLVPLLTAAAVPHFLAFASEWLGTGIGRFAVLPGAFAVAARYVGARAASRPPSQRFAVIVAAAVIYAGFVVVATDNWIVETGAAVSAVALVADAHRGLSTRAES